MRDITRVFTLAILVVMVVIGLYQIVNAETLTIVVPEHSETQWTGYNGLVLIVLAGMGALFAVLLDDITR